MFEKLNIFKRKKPKEVNIFAVSDVGKERDHNEDAFLVNNKIGRDETIKTNISLNDKFVCAVADGMGGHAAGEVASEKTLTEIKNSIGQKKLKRLKKAKKIINKKLEDINELVLNMEYDDLNYKGMGTTLCGVYNYKKSDLFFFNVGDSRIYKYENNTLKQISKDHSQYQQAKDAGMDEEELKNIPRNMITNAVGGGIPNIFCDIDILTKKKNLKENDLFLICSDGLTDMVNDELIQKVLNSKKSIEEKGQSLVKKAKENGGKDNITIIIMEVKNKNN